MAIFGSLCRCVHTLIILNHTERAELVSGLRMFVRAHLRLRINQSNQGGVLTALNRLIRDFEGSPNSSISVRPPSGLVPVVPGAIASFLFRASSSTTPISNFGLYEHQTPLLAHSPRVARGAPPSRHSCVTDTKTEVILYYSDQNPPGREVA